MIVEKRINNNVALARKNGQQLIVMGKGVGFGKHSGDQIAEDQVEKTFYSEGSLNLEQMASLITDASGADIEVVDGIIRYGQVQIKESLNPNIFFTLLDHICFSLQRYEKQMDISNPLDWEIKKFYPIEYGIGKFAVTLIREQLKVNISDAEASFIALHFVNAQIESSVHHDGVQMVEMTNDILQLVRYQLNCDYDEDSWYFQRFITHLRYYLMRQKNGVIQENGDQNELVDMVFSRFNKEKNCVDLIDYYLQEKQGWHTSNIEKMYLILHLRNLVEKKNRL